MKQRPPAGSRWTDALAAALLSAFAFDDLATLSGEMGEHVLADDRTAVELRTRLRKAAREQAACRLAVMRTWRTLRADVVSAAMLIPIDGSAEQCEALLRQFGAEDVLLELITDQDDDGWLLAEHAVENVKSDSVRKELADILQLWSLPEDTAAEPLIAGPSLRVVIFGGHIRDEKKICQQRFDQVAIDVRWKPCETCLGSPDAKVIHEAMANADAALLVTSMVSHNVMRLVKRFTQRHGIPFRAIPKATKSQLIAAFSELFPARVRRSE